MKYKILDVIDVKGSIAYLDFYGKIEIITITNFEKAREYQEDFFDWWFGEEDEYYLDCKRANEKVYIGKFIEGNSIVNKGKVIAFLEEFLELDKTKRIL